jgi:hypothetical protein
MPDSVKDPHPVVAALWLTVLVIGTTLLIHCLHASPVKDRLDYPLRTGHPQCIEPTVWRYEAAPPATGARPDIPAIDSQPVVAAQFCTRQPAASHDPYMGEFVGQKVFALTERYLI